LASFGKALGLYKKGERFRIVAKLDEWCDGILGLELKKMDK
jgi:hypothetical protein